MGHKALGVLTLFFDDIEKEVDEAILFSAVHAKKIVDFIEKYRHVDTLLIHCYGGQSRSRAVGAFAVRMLGGDNSRYLSDGNPNRCVYNTRVSLWQKSSKNDN